MERHERDELIISHLGQVRLIASRMCRAGVPGFAFDDLCQSGILGLIDAIDKFSLDRGRFSTYAEHRIRGAMLDGLRKMDHLPHRERAKVRAGDESFSIVGIDNTARTIPAPQADALSSVLALDTRSRLHDCIRRLRLSDRQVIVLHYFHGWSIAMIARRFRLSDGRISQIHNRALRRLRQLAGAEMRARIGYYA